MRYVIIGSGAAGAQAAEELRKIHKSSEITVISEELNTPYSRCLLPKFVDGRLTREQLYFKTGHFYQDYDLKALVGVKAVKVDSNNKNVVTENGKKIDYDKLLIATGSRPFLPRIGGTILKGVSSFHMLKDAISVMENVKHAKHAVVIGAGFVGLEVAYSLVKLGLKVTVVERCSQILPNQFDIAASQILQKDLEGLGVDIILDESLSTINGEKEVEEITIGEKFHIACQLVIMATGVRPNTGLADIADLKMGRAITVDGYLRTSDPDIYAAGDVIEINNLTTGTKAPSATWLNAVLQGKFAAINMAGGKKRYTGSIGIQNSVQFHEIPAISYGKTSILAEEREDYSTMSLHLHDKKIYKKLILKGNRLCGMILVGDIERAGFYAALIRNEISIEKVKDQLLDRNFNPAIFKHEYFGEYNPYQVEIAV